MVSRRQALLRLAASSGVLALTSSCRGREVALSGPCPSLRGRRLRWIVPNAAGGGYDTESRLLQPRLSRQLGAEIVIDNQAGAGGLVGARAIAGARPDGTTVGILGVPGLLVASLMGETQAPDPSTAFTVLGRIARSWHVWGTGASSPLPTIDAVVAASAHRPLVCAINEVGSANFVSITASAALLGIDVEFVGGFAGTRSACLAAMRGDVDLVCFNYETIADLFKAGDLRPLLQVSVARIGGDQVLDDVPVLGGLEGYAARRARARGEDVDVWRAAADGLADVMGGGRIVVAPAGLPGPIASCLVEAVGDVLASPELRASTRRVLDTAPAAVALADVRRAAHAAPQLLPAVRTALTRMRG